LSDNGTRTLVVGALGVIGRNVVEHLQSLDRSVLGLSRRQPAPDQSTASPHVIADISDNNSVAGVADQFGDVTHLVFAAYQEHATLAAQIAPNMALLTGALDAMRTAQAPLQHVTLYQGHKYYGSHLGPFKTPAYESDPRLPGPNFYYDQENLLRARAAEDGFSFTILRPEAVCGIATGNPMNLLTAIAVYATLCREEGIPFRFTGPAEAAAALYQVTDARLLARATAWAGHAPGARNEVFNVTNGDIFRWRQMSERIAAYFGVDYAPAQELKLAEHMPSYEPIWDALIARHNLHPTPYREIAAWNFADMIFNSTWDNVSSTIKIRQAGFHDCIDTETMFRQHFDDLADRRLIPATRH
jgi:nucleoside-diphosphate-sugar epimerase